MSYQKIQEKDAVYHRTLKMARINLVEVEGEAKAIDFIASILLKYSRNANQ